MRVGLVACSAQKLARAAPARELYQGDVFKKSVRWMEHHDRVAEWAILSALHGLVLPDQVLEPYECSLSSGDNRSRVEWAERTKAQILERWGQDTVYMLLLPGHYVAATLGLRYREDVIAHWTEQRRRAGTRPAHIGIGVLKRYLKEMRGFY